MYYSIGCAVKKNSGNNSDIDNKSNRSLLQFQAVTTSTDISI